MNNSLAPILLFVYNRPTHVDRVLKMLEECPESKDSNLTIVSDGPKNIEDELRVNEVRKVIHKNYIFKKIDIIENKENLGIEKNELMYITKIVNKYGKIIVLEDDLLINKGFLKFINDSLIKYDCSKNVFSVTGYTYIENSEYPDSFFTKMPSSWGWGTWKDKWSMMSISTNNINQLLNSRKYQKIFNCYDAYPWYELIRHQLDNKTQITWDLLWHWTVIYNNGLILYPKYALSLNGGFDGTGVHCKKEKKNVVFNKDNILIETFPQEEKENVKIAKDIARKMKKNYPLFDKIKRKIKRVL